MSAIANISLYIPYVFPNFDKEYVANAFKRIGEVSEIDFVAKQGRNGNNYNSVYIHFNKWYTNKRTLAFYDSVVDANKEARLCHDEPWYWIVLPNTAKKHLPGERKPKINLGEANVLSKSNARVLPSLPATPLRDESNNICPNAPHKISYADVIKSDKNDVCRGLEDCFQEVASVDDDFNAQMDEIEKIMDEEDANLVSVDGRYLAQIEAENLGMGIEITQLRSAIINLNQMYQAEVAKVCALSMQQA